MSLIGKMEDLGCKVAVLCGGNSSEREVSLVSGRSVAQALETARVPYELFELAENSLPEGLDPATHIVLPVMHGTYGEDGGLSADLDRAGFAYAGCGAASSVLCFDKLVSKAVASRLGVPVAEDRWLSPGHMEGFSDLAEALGLPFILKPRSDGSSVGLHLVSCESDFDSARDELARTDYLAERYAQGYDLTVGLLEGRAMGIVGVHPEGGLYDYEHKYTSGKSRYEVPARIDPALAGQLREWSELIFHACGCRDLARVDYRLSGHNEVIFLEINTIPGMTPTSLLPKSAQIQGVSFEQLVLNWVEFALKRFKDKS